jgi:hypothetical protein
MCTYLAKGNADYVGVWDFDEFFIPRGTNKNILDVLKKMDYSPNLPYSHPAGISSMELYKQGWKGGRGLADGDGHPFCYLSLESEVTLFSKKILKYDILDQPWMGQR